VVEIQAWVHDYQHRIVQAGLGHQHMNLIEFPRKTADGQGEWEMPDVNLNLGEMQLSELAQQVVHTVQACHKETEIQEDQF